MFTLLDFVSLPTFDFAKKKKKSNYPKIWYDQVSGNTAFNFFCLTLLVVSNRTCWSGAILENGLM